VVDYSIEQFQYLLGLRFKLGLGLACAYSVDFPWFKKNCCQRVD